MREKIKNSNALIAIGLTIVFVVVICCCWDLYYAVNDDVTTRNVIFGKYTGSAHPQGTLIKYPLAALLSGLFYIFSNIDVYGLFLVTSHFVCFFMISRSVLQKFPRQRVWVLLLVGTVFFMADVPNIIYFQFTTTATMYAATGTFLLLTEKPVMKKMLPSICLFALSFCIRKETFVMILPFIALTWLLKVYENRKEFKSIVLQGILYFLALGVLCVGINMVHNVANWEGYQNKSYQEFSLNRTNVRDYDGVPDYDTNLEFYQSIGENGMTREEYNLIRYQMVDMDFSTDINSVLNDMHQYNLVIRSNIGFDDRMSLMKERFQNVSQRIMVKPQVMIGVLLLFLAGIYLAATKKWIYLLFLATGCMGVTAEVVLLLYNGRLPERVLQSLMLIAVLWILGICVQAFYNISKTEDSHKKTLDIIWYSLAVLSCLIVFVGWLFPAIIEKQQEYAERYAKSELVNEYCSQHSENIYFSPYNFLSGDTDCLGTGYSNQFDNRIRIGLGSFAPTYYDMLETAGISITPEQAIVTQGNAYLIGENVEDELIALDNYFSEKYGDTYSYEVVDVLDGDIYVWKVHLDEP